MASVFIYADVPADFRPKAVFALKTMLSAFFLRKHIKEVPAGDFSPDEGDLKIYYGPEAEKNKDKFDLCLHHDTKSAAFFREERVLKQEEVRFTQEAELPVLFGDAVDEGAHHKIIHADLPASAFYFLSDWEFWCGPESPDMHGRLVSSESLLYRLGYADKPLVNAFAELIFEKLCGVRPEIADSSMLRKSRFYACITHDLDYIRKRYRGTVKRELFDIPLMNAHGLPVKERVSRCLRAVVDLLSPHDAWQESIRGMLEFETQNGIPPTVFLKSILEKHARDAADYHHDPFLDEIILNTKQAGGEIGLHASYEAGYNEPLFTAEKLKLEKRLGQPVGLHRFHYLRYPARRIARMLQKNEISADSSVGWADRAGFRSGFTWPYYLFDHQRNMESAVLEVPMHMMEVQCFNYMKMNPEQALSHCRKQADTVKQHGGMLCWNFHQHALDESETPGGSFLFKESLGYLQTLNPVFITLDTAHENL